MVTLAKTETGAGEWTVTVTLPLARLRPGPYILTLDARLAGNRRIAATRHLRFWIVDE